jgi:hypothetical protein
VNAMSCVDNACLLGPHLLTRGLALPGIGASIWSGVFATT